MIYLIDPQEDKRNREAEAKRKRLEEAERKRQAMMQAMQKQKESVKPNYVITKKDGTTVSANQQVSRHSIDPIESVDQRIKLIEFDSFFR